MRIAISLLLGVVIGFAAYLISGALLYGVSVGSGRATGFNVLLNLATRPVPIIIGTISFAIVLWLRLRN